jgi:hypothetical protein
MKKFMEFGRIYSESYKVYESPRPRLTRLSSVRFELIPGLTPIYVIDGEVLDAGMRICPALVQRLIIGLPKVVCCHMTPLQKAKVRCLLLFPTIP